MNWNFESLSGKLVRVEYLTTPSLSKDIQFAILKTCGSSTTPKAHW